MTDKDVFTIEFIVPSENEILNYPNPKKIKKKTKQKNERCKNN